MRWYSSGLLRHLSQRPATIPGIGPIIATAIAATVVERGREFAAWLGLVPRQNSTGGKNRLGGISKRGNQYLRRLLINGASANVLGSKATNANPWVIGQRRRRPKLGRGGGTESPVGLDMASTGSGSADEGRLTSKLPRRDWNGLTMTAQNMAPAMRDILSAAEGSSDLWLP